MKVDVGLATIHTGNNVEVLKEYPDNHFSALVTDPPYGLSDEPNMVEVLQHWLNDKDYKHTSSGFMNSKWDSFVPNPNTFKEIFRVMKPGAYGVVFAGSRTQDLMSVSLRLAGFKIVDTLQWIYGTGLPKGKDISKGIDKHLGCERSKTKVRFTENQLYGMNGQNTRAWKTKAKELGFHEVDDKTPVSNEAKLWNGYNTQLKPAYEPIILIQKPIIEKNIVENCLKHGAGSINIDASRITIPEEDDIFSKNPNTITVRNHVDRKGIYGDCDAEEALYDNFHNKAVLIDGYVWMVDSEELPSNGFNVVKRNSDGSMSFVMMYYNGSCGFS